MLPGRVRLRAKSDPSGLPGIATAERMPGVEEAWSRRYKSSFQTPENGSSSGTPVTTMSATLRVTNVRPCTLAVAASRPSIKGNGLGIPRSAQTSATGSSIGRTRPPSLVRICKNHRSRDAACSGSLRRFSSIPWRISASTSTLVPMSSTGVRVTQWTTFGWARSRLRISEMTFVSSRNFTDQPGANLVGAAGQKRP
jgi:hypothetical protein